MKLVEFTRDMAPIRAGERRLLPDDVAAGLAASGHGVPSDWPQTTPAQAPGDGAAVRPPRQVYKTKKVS